MEPIFKKKFLRLRGIFRMEKRGHTNKWPKLLAIHKRFALSGMFCIEIRYRWSSPATV